MERMNEFFTDMQAVSGIALILCLLYIQGRRIVIAQGTITLLIFFMVMFESFRILFPAYAPLAGTGLRITLVFVFLTTITKKELA